MYIDHSYLFFVGGGYDGCDIYRDHQAKQARVEEKRKESKCFWSWSRKAGPEELKWWEWGQLDAASELPAAEQPLDEELK